MARDVKWSGSETVASNQLVEVHDSRLMVGGNAYRPVGLNLPWSFGWGGSKMPTSQQHSAMFRLFPAGSMFRLWAFGNWAPAQIRALVDLGRPHGHRFVLCLADYLGAQSGEKYVSAAGGGSQFVAGAWRTRWRDGHLIPMLKEFAEDPAVAMWEWLNEPDPSLPLLGDFFEEVGSLARGMGDRHLICSGTAASWGSGADLAKVNSSAFVDVVSAHEYDQQSPMSHWVMRDLSLRSGKPLLVGESGLATSSFGSAEARGQQIAAKVSAAAQHAEICGYLYWSGAAPGSFGPGDFEISVSDGPEVKALAAARLA